MQMKLTKKNNKNEQTFIYLHHRHPHALYLNHSHQSCRKQLLTFSQGSPMSKEPNLKTRRYSEPSDVLESGKTFQFSRYYLIKLGMQRATKNTIAGANGLAKIIKKSVI